MEQQDEPHIADASTGAEARHTLLYIPVKCEAAALELFRQAGDKLTELELPQRKPGNATEVPPPAKSDTAPPSTVALPRQEAVQELDGTAEHWQQLTAWQDVEQAGMPEQQQQQQQQPFNLGVGQYALQQHQHPHQHQQQQVHQQQEQQCVPEQAQQLRQTSLVEQTKAEQQSSKAEKITSTLQPQGNAAAAAVPGRQDSSASEPRAAWQIAVDKHVQRSNSCSSSISRARHSRWLKKPAVSPHGNTVGSTAGTAGGAAGGTTAGTADLPELWSGLEQGNSSPGIAAAAFQQQHGSSRQLSAEAEAKLCAMYKVQPWEVGW